MGRPYAPEDVEKAAAGIRSLRNDPFFACDIIAGFPGESAEDFKKTLLLCEKLDFAWIHAFPFSRRPGTAAFDFPGRVSEREAAARVEQLRLLAIKGRHEYISRWEGKEVDAIVETGKGLLHAHAPALSENYLKLLVFCGDAEIPAAGKQVRCRIEKTLLKTGARIESSSDENRILKNQFDAFAIII
jgi:threonylcarbamoyladenosine tRNA methylthiotransferase MtaB